MSHRALLFGAVAQGVTRIDGLLEAGDVLSTAAALRAFGVAVEKRGSQFAVRGRPFAPPSRALDLGNAGTGARLLMGLAAGQRVPFTVLGDPSLMRRPMGRVLDPLALMGAKWTAREGRLPASFEGSALKGIRYALPVPSAQVKSALLLAGLGASGPVTIIEPEPTRDHTERMLQAFGADITRQAEEITLRPGRRLVLPKGLAIPADPSSAAFPLVAALITEGSEITCEEVLMNPRRTGFLRALKRMGADLTIAEGPGVGGEETASVTARFGKLGALHLEKDDVPDLVDEVPILAVAAAMAEGASRFEGVAELRVKESDRLAKTASLLEAAGVIVRTGEDWLEVEGTGGKAPKGGASIDTDHDHRIGMAALVLGLVSEEPITITGAEAIATSFPGFTETMNGTGARIASP
jgi:3-phosphoshikimate 1-carboxyvinyltransferase